MRLHHEVTGPCDAPAIVLSNSLGSTLAIWDSQIASLSEGYRVVRYDLRGHGRSPVISGPSTLADLSDDLVAIIDRLEIQRASLCGISLGGMISMHVAAHHPDRVDRLAAACTSALLGPRQRWLDRAQLVRRDGTAAVVDRVVGAWLTPSFARAHETLNATLRAMVASTDALGYASCCHAIANMDLRADLERIAARTLVIAGADDPATPMEHAQVIADAIPDAQLRVLDHAAHLANIEQPELFTSALLDHLQA